MTEQADLRALEIEAARRVGWTVESFSGARGERHYRSVDRGKGSVSWDYWSTPEIARQAGFPAYATDLNACWRDLVAWLTARGWFIRIERGQSWALACLIRDATKRVVVDGPADASVAELLLRGFLKATEECCNQVPE